MREPGISFILRARNEEATIAECIESLRQVTVPHEIVVVLHMCDDGTEEIVKRLRDAGTPIHLAAYSGAISRPGYEMLVTPCDHPHSIPTYYNRCQGQARFNWTMKWDADFVCSDELGKFLSDLPLDQEEPEIISLATPLGQWATNVEPLLSNCLKEFRKHAFWEVPFYLGFPRQTKIDPVVHHPTSNALKSYWNPEPWFIGKEPVLQERYEYLVNFMGEEPRGMAAAGNRTALPYYDFVKNHEEKLRDEAGILLWE